MTLITAGLTLMSCVHSLGGVTMVCLSDEDLENKSVPSGAIWALVSALFYALYLVLVKRKVQNEDKMDIPMFFGK